MVKGNVYLCPEQVSLYTVSHDQNVSDWYINHNHPFWELVVFEHGEGKHFINHIAYPFKPGCIALLSPTDVHCWTNDEGTTHDCFKVRFSFSLYNNRFSEICKFSQFPAVATLSNRDFEKAMQILHILADEYSEPNLTESNTMAVDMIEALLILLQRSLPGNRNVRKDTRSKSQKILLYIQEHFSEPITVTGAAQALNYSPKYFSRLFSNEFGITFQEYLKSIRLNYAYHLIMHSDNPIIDICYSSGFHSPTYFSTAFKDKYGQSPNSLRKQRDAHN